MGLGSQDCCRGVLQAQVNLLCDSLEYLKCLTMCQKTLCCRLTRYQERLDSDQTSKESLFRHGCSQSFGECW